MRPALSSSSGRLRRLALAVAVVGLTGACRVDTTVAVQAERDGTGVVRATAQLDDAAAGAVGDLEQQLRVADLREAGWTVIVGERTVTVSKPFDDPREAGDVLRELGGPIVSTASLDRVAGFAKTAAQLEVTVDLTGGLESFSDADVARQLGPMPLGVPADEVTATLTLVGDLAGGETVTADAPLGQRTSLTAAATDWQLGRILAAAAAVGSAVAAIVIWLRQRRSVPLDVTADP